MNIFLYLHEHVNDFYFEIPFRKILEVDVILIFFRSCIYNFYFETGSFGISYLYVVPSSAQKLFSLELLSPWSYVSGCR